MQDTPKREARSTSKSPDTAALEAARRIKDYVGSPRVQLTFAHDSTLCADFVLSSAGDGEECSGANAPSGGPGQTQKGEAK